MAIARRPFALCRWSSNPLAPLVHAQEVAQHLKHVKLRTYRLGGHLIYVGDDGRVLCGSVPPNAAKYGEQQDCTTCGDGDSS